MTNTWCVEFQHHPEVSCTACFHTAAEDVVPSVVPASLPAPTNQHSAATAGMWHHDNIIAQDVTCEQLQAATHNSCLSHSRRRTRIS